MFKALLEITKPDEFNFVSPCGLGDTMFICALKPAIEKRYQTPIHLIIKPTHEVVMYMYDIADYSIYQFTDAELRGIAKNNYHPQKGRLYIAHPVFSDNEGIYKNSMSLTQMYLDFFRLDENTTLLKPVKYPQIPKNIAAKFPDMNNIVLLLPEARSVHLLEPGFWKNLARGLREKGFTLLQSCSDRDLEIEGVTALPDDIPGVIAVALACYSVYSLRSGLCDLIADKVKRLTVFYPTQAAFLFNCIEGKAIENVLVDVDKKHLSAVKGNERIEVLKKNIKKALRVIPPIKQLANRFKRIDTEFKRIDTEIENAINGKFAEL